MTPYKQALCDAMRELAQDPAVCFLGYGVKHGMAMGTLKGIAPEQLIETPVAENLMVGMAMGMAMAGRRPVVYFERFDFILNALDALVNHLDKCGQISKGEFTPAVIIRVTLGNVRKGLRTGMTHTQDYTEVMRKLVSFPVLKLEHAQEIQSAYRCALQDVQKAGGFARSTMLVERKDEMID